MTAPRRRIVRPAATSRPRPAQCQPPLHRLGTRLERERTALARWQKRLWRAFNAVEKIQKSIARLERRLARQEE